MDALALELLFDSQPSCSLVLIEVTQIAAFPYVATIVFIIIGGGFYLFLD